MNFFLIVVSVLISSLGQILLKYGAIKSNIGGSPTSFNLITMLNVPNVIGIILYGISAILWMLVLKRVELSLAYPMVSLGYVFIIIASYFLFNETINVTKIIGVVFVIAGIIFISRS